MTISDSGKANTLNATEIDLRAADFLQRRQFWTWTEDNQAELDAWLDESDKHRVAYLRQSAVWASAERLTVLRPAAPSETRAHPFPWSLMFRAAAAFIVVAIAGAGIAYFSQPRAVTYATPVGGREILTLGDGSKIELNTNSVVRLSKSGNTRQAQLIRGEAYFHIHHDIRHPFVVRAGTYRITDIGTEFVVHRLTTGVQVGLLAGGARFDASDVAGAPQSALLTPGDVVIADANSMSMSKEPVAEIAAELSWRRGLLIFKDSSLEDAAAEFNRYNHEKIVIAGGDVAQLKINGTFKAQNVDLFAQSVRQLFGLRVEQAGTEIIIAR